ncbi:MAG: hypothetical protein KC588_16625 [Nitrospira sp.]|nr:hypothetical protein [Nitrospira sp.]
MGIRAVWNANVDRLIENQFVGFVYMLVVLPLFLLFLFGVAIGAFPGLLFHGLLWKEVKFNMATEQTKITHDLSLIFLGGISAVLFFIYVLPNFTGLAREDQGCPTKPYC